MPTPSTHAPSGGAPEPKILERVRALLDKAESTPYPEEAEALSAKAQELMAKYAIDQLAVDVARGASGGATGVERLDIVLDQAYASPKSMLLGNVARANRSRAIWSSWSKTTTVFGRPADLAVVELLFTSLLAQATAAMLAASQRGEHGSSVRSFRHSFLVAYADRIGQRLEEAARVATEEAVAEHRAEGSDLAPVLVANEEAVIQAMKDAFPRIKARSISVSNGKGYLAGRDAADRADLGRPDGRIARRPKGALT